MAAQIVHAAGESVKSEIPPGTNAVVLSVPDETSLILLARKLQLAGIPHILIKEVDPPFTNQVTAIGVSPTSDRALLKPFLSSLPLLKNAGVAQVVERQE